MMPLRKQACTATKSMLIVAMLAATSNGMAQQPASPPEAGVIAPVELSVARCGR